jgi:cell division septal protein FtsQ
MKLKQQPKPRAGRPAGRRSMARRGAARPRNRMARRTGVPLRRRLGSRLPSLGRVVAFLAAACATAALVALASGPWLRVAEVDWDGGRYTPSALLEDALEDERGRAVLAVDTVAVRDRLEALPSVVEASVSASLTGGLTASIVEARPAFVWQTSRARLVGAEDGTLFAIVAREGRLPKELAGLPSVADERVEGRLLAVGDRVPAALLRTAKALAAIDPAELGSNARRFSVAVDDDYGFRLRSASPEWEVAFGVYGLDPRETAAAADARLERQVTAVRTLFATRDEAEIGWVDVRNPGKVYFRAKG